MERLLQMGEGGRPRQRRIMELNPRDEIFTKIRQRYEQNNNDEAIAKYAQLLHGYALLAEGSEVLDPAQFNRRLVELMTQSF
jgi:molecular chaperone HtpG